MLFGRRFLVVLRKLWEVFRDTYRRWDESGPWRQSAILAYYSIFSLPALLLIVIVMVGYFYGEEAVSQQLSGRIADMIGKESAIMIETMVANAADTGSSRIAILAGIGFLLFGATSLFYHLQLSLNRIWGVVPKPRQAFLKYMKDRLLSFGLVLAIGLLLTALLFALGQYGLRIYFSNYDPASVYGTAGAMILILIWISYVAMIVLFGAEFTRQWANKFGHGIRPKSNAVLYEDMEDKYPVAME